MTSDTTLTKPSTVPGSRIGMTPSRKVALWGGLLYLLTFAASLPQLALFADLVDDPTGYITSPGSDTTVQLGSWLEIVTALAGVGTAVALYPITRRVSRSAAIGFVTSRVVEAAVIFAGVMSVLAVVTLRGEYAGAVGAEETAVGVTGEALVAMRQATFLIGPGIMPAINALFLGYVLYRSGLVPRILPTDRPDRCPTAAGLGHRRHVRRSGPRRHRPPPLLTLPIALWEFALGVYLTVKGFRASPVTDAVDAAGTHPRRTS